MQDMNTLTVFPKGFSIDQHENERDARQIVNLRLQRLLELNDNGPIHKLDMSNLPLDYPIEGVREICQVLTGRVSSVTHATFLYGWPLSPERAQSPLLESISIPMSRQVLEVMSKTLSLSTLREVTFGGGKARVGFFARLREIMSTVTDQTNASPVFDNLELLHVKSLHMSEKSSQELADLLCEVPNLRSFAYSASSNGRGSMRVIEGLRDSGGTSLEKLVFEGLMFKDRNRNVYERSCQPFKDLLSRQCRLTSLNVSCCFDVEESNALRSIAQGLSASGARLTELRLADWNFLSCLDQLIVLIEMQACSLQVLGLPYSRLGANDNAAFDRFTGALSRLTDLRILDLWNCEIGNDAGKAAALAGALGNLAHLEEIRISANGLSADDVQTLLPSLPKLLQVVDLSENKLGDNGAVALAARVPHMERLRVLDLNYCRIAVSGATAIAGSVRDLPCLEVLKLCGNEGFSDPGVAPLLARSIADLPSLRELDFSFCGIGDNAVLLLARMLRRTPSLTSLKLNGNGITITGYRVLLAALRDYQGQGPGRHSIAPNFTLTSLQVVYDYDWQRHFEVVYDDDVWQRQFDFYCQLNAAGRGSFLMGDTGTENWLRGLQKMDAEAGLSGILYALVSKPDFAKDALRET